MLDSVADVVLAVVCDVEVLVVEVTVKLLVVLEMLVVDVAVVSVAVVEDAVVDVVLIIVVVVVDVQLLQHLSVTNAPNDSCTQNPFSPKYSQVNTIPFSSPNPV